MYINKNTHEILFDVIPKGVDWIKVPNGTELIFKHEDVKDFTFVRIFDGLVLIRFVGESVWVEYSWKDFNDIKSYKGNTIIWEKDLQSNVEKTDVKKPKKMHLALDVNGEYKVRSNTVVLYDTFIMDLLEGVEVLTNYKGKNEWYQWKPSENLTDNECGVWEECGYGFDTYDDYLNRNKEYLTIIDLRVATASNEADVNNTTHDVVHDVVHHPKHYTEDPSGVECIQLTSLLPCCLSNSLKYLWRCGKKDEDLQELKKALFYINYSIEHNLPSFIQGVSDTFEFESLINQVKKHWNGDKYMFIDALYWGDQPTMKRAIENMICNIEITTSNIEK